MARGGLLSVGRQPAAQNKLLDQLVLLIGDGLEIAGETRVVRVEAGDVKIEHRAPLVRGLQGQDTNPTDGPSAEIGVGVLNLNIEAAVTDVAKTDADSVDVTANDSLAAVVAAVFTARVTDNA